MHDFLTLRPAAAGSHGESNAAISEPDRRLCNLLPYREEIAPPPEVVALSLDVLSASLARLAPESGLLIAYPAESRNRVGARHLGTSVLGRDPRHPAGWRMNRKM